MDLLECSLCNYQYDSSKRRARTLPCIHYFCQDCLDKIIKSATPHCPTCRAHVTINSAEKLPPNFLMDDLISKMKIGTVLVDSTEKDEDFTAGTCPKHKKCQLYFTCKTHNVKICRDCTVITHSPSNCNIISFEDELSETKQKTLDTLKTQHILREKNINDLQEVIIKKESQIQEKKVKVAELQKEINESEQFIKSANGGIEECSHNKNKINKIRQDLVYSIKINQINHSCREAEVIIKASNYIGISLEQNFGLFSSKSLENVFDQCPDDFVNKILQGKAAVYASAEVNGQKCFAEIFVKNGDIHLPALSPSNMQPSTTENIVAVSSLLTRYADACIYLTIASSAGELGTVYVTLRDNDSAKYTRKLCTGVLGPSYRGTRFSIKHFTKAFYTENITENYQCQCSETPPPKPVPSTMSKGNVYIEYETGLGICMYNCGNVGNIIGHVNKGMVVLEDAWASSSRMFTIKDVGIVLK